MKLIDSIKKLYNDKTKRKMISSVAFLSLLLIVIMVSVLAFGKQAYGWFAENKTVEATDLQVTPRETEYDISVYNNQMVKIGTLSSGSTISFDLDLPGSVDYFVLEVENNTNTDLTLSELGFDRPDLSEDRPVVVDGNSYYLSTQLKVIGKFLQTNKPTAANLASNFTSNEVGNFLTTPVAEGSTPSFAEFSIWNSGSSKVTVAANSSVFFAIKITFYNDTEHTQNQYRNFGTSKSITPSSCCKRRVFIKI